MSGNRWLASLLSLALSLAFQSSLWAQGGAPPAIAPHQKGAAAPPSGEASASATPKPSTYVGTTVCKACHKTQAQEFTDTMMGNLCAPG